MTATEDWIAETQAELRAYQRSDAASFREFRAQRSAEPITETKGDDEMDQGTFWRWIGEGTDQSTSEETEKERKALAAHLKAMMQMGQQAMAQPAISDQIHCVQRVRQMAVIAAKAADALAKGMEGGE